MKKKVILIALVAVLSLASTACGVSTVTQETTLAETTSVETTAEPTTEEPTTEEPTTEEPTTEKPTEPPTEEPTEPSYYTTGQTYEDGSLDITFKSVEDYTNYEDYEAPASGNKVIRAFFEIKNNGNSSYGVGSWSFSCYADDNVAEDWYCLSDDAQELTAYEDLSKGRTVKGYIYYEVPKNAKSIEIEYEPTDAWLDEADSIVFKVK